MCYFHLEDFAGVSAVLVEAHDDIGEVTVTSARIHLLPSIVNTRQEAVQ